MDPNQIEAVSVPPDNVVSYWTEYGSLPDLGPSLQFLKPMALAEVAYQVYETVPWEKVCYLLDLWDPHFFEVHVQVPEENGVPEALQGLLQVRQVLRRPLLRINARMVIKIGLE